MKPYRYLDNAFWEVPDKSIVKCIRIADLGQGKTKKDILAVRKINKDGTPNPQYKEIVDSIGEAVIDKYTQERLEKKEREHQENLVKHEQKKQAAHLEGLFGAKIRAMEIEEVKNTKNKKLRSKIRRANSELEVTALVSLIIGEEMGLFGNNDE